MAILQKWMTEHGVSDDDLAEKLGVSRVQVSRLRREKCKPSVATAQRLADVTKMPAAIFIFGDAA